MKTRDELLKAAESSIHVGFNNDWNNNPGYSQAAFLNAIACVLLAKEMREGVQGVIRTDHDLEREATMMLPREG